jgi:hypothetical protein
LLLLLSGRNECNMNTTCSLSNKLKKQNDESE